MSELIEELPEGFRMTELGPLPVEWEVINLGEVIDLKRGISWRKEEANREGIGVPVISIPNIKENGSIEFSDTYFLNKDVSDEKMLRINDILFVGSSGSIKNIGRNVLIREIPQNRFTYASFTFLGRVSSIKVDNKYLFYLLNSPVVDFTKYTRRASDGKYNFQLTQFKNEQKIPLPPLTEQKKIAAVLSAVQEAKEKTEAVINAAKDLKKSMMKHLFTYGPVSPQDAENVPLKETELGMIPEEWEVVRLGDVVIKNKGIQRGPWGGSIKKEIFVPAGYVVYEQGNVISGNVTNFRYFIDENKFKELKDFEVRGGDILITAAGTLGKLIILPDKIHKGIINQALIRIRLNETMINKIYFKYLFNRVVEQGIIAGYSHGATLKNLSSIRMLQEIKIPLPPLPTQQKIASILSAIDQKIQAEENKKKALEDLFKTLLHNLMTAKIRVNHLEAET